MGADFDDVRVHIGPEPARIARSLQATAFTLGRDIYFGTGAYAPATSAGRRLLAHELAHTITEPVGGGGRQPVIGRAADPVEAAADDLADNALRVLRSVSWTAERGPTDTKGFPRPHPLAALRRHAATGKDVVRRYLDIDVNVQRSQLLRDPGASKAVQYGWTSRFLIRVPNSPADPPQISVVIYLKVAPDVVKRGVFDTWRKNVGDRWNRKFAIGNGATRYPVHVELEVAERITHYDIVNVRADTASAGRGLFGTESMTTWGESDSQDIPHEVGHMLGNKDEYGTVDGRDWGKEIDLLSPDTHSVMFRGDMPVRQRHFDLIVEEIKRRGVLGPEPTVTKISKLGGLGGPPGPVMLKGPPGLGLPKRTPVPLRVRVS